MAEIRIVACDSAQEVGEAIGYWSARGFGLLGEDIRNVTDIRVYDEDVGPQRLFKQQYKDKGVRMVMFLKE